MSRMDTPEEVPDSKTERIAGMRHELAELQRQLSEAQQRLATELKGRAEDADRFEELETRLQQHTVKTSEQVAELTGERDNLKAFLDSANSAMEAVRQDLAAREARIEESAKQSRELADEAASLRDKHRELTETLEKHERLMIEATTRLSERDAELATRSSERDALQAAKARLEGELEEARRALDERKSRVQAIARQLTSFGQELLDGAPTATAEPAAAPLARPARTGSSPPPPPGSPQRPRTPSSNEIIVLEERPAIPVPEAPTLLEAPAPAPAPARSPGRGLALVLSGVAVGVVCSLVIGRLREPGGTAAAKPQEDVAAAPLSETATDSIDPDVAASALPVDTAGQPAGVTSPAPAPSSSSTGTIVLPARADGRRVFIDGRLVEVKDRRAEVPCGKHQVQIGSRGTARELDVVCGAETEVP